jgi:serine/threonine-protein kinase
VLIGHLQLPPPTPRSLASQIPEAYEAVILKCLQKKQEDRYQTMREVHDAIAEVMDQLGISRELPNATAEELAAVASATKTRTNPGAASKTPARAAVPRKTPAQRAVTVATPPPPLPQKSRAGVYIGASVAALAIAGAVAAFALQQAAESRQAAERQARIVAERLAQEARAAALRAEEEQRRLQEEKVQLSVVSDPVGAIVEATWKDGVKAAVTPFDLAVPKNASVHFAFSKKEYQPSSTDVVADGPKVVRASLLAEPKAAPPPRVPRIRATESSAKKSTPAEKDDTIPVEF